MKTNLIVFFLIGVLFAMQTLSAQTPVSYTANNQIAEYDGYFLYGSNMAWRGNGWSDEQLAGILCDTNNIYGSAGANSLRPALYDRFVAQYGINFRKPTFDYYNAIGAKVNTIFLSGPRDAYKERPCPLTTEEEALPYELPASFKNLYKPIWITENGQKKVNPENYYAQYVFDVVSNFRQYTRFWEIWNEPDLTYKGNGDKASGQAGNWWDANPDPCELHNLRAPVQHYNRILRISYEVIKSIDPDAIVCTGGIGYASFLDAILRNTDADPYGETVEGETHELKGGAWFDYVSYHVYPMYYMRQWHGYDEEHPDGFTYFRHTDKALEAAMNHKEKLEKVLLKYGYDGTTYPKKKYILSETNIPSERVKGNDVGHGGKKWFIGSDEAQRNYVTKVAIASQMNDIDAIYIYCPYDNYKDPVTEGGEYDYMGFFKYLPDNYGGVGITLKESGKAWNTMVKQLSRRKYHAEETQTLALPATLDGGAFYSLEEDDFMYVLWAKTSKDLEETVSVEYMFPESLHITSIEYVQWDGTLISVSGNTVPLTGSPVFIKVSSSGPAPISVAGISLGKDTVELEKDDMYIFEPVITPVDATDKSLVWESSDPAVVSVSQQGIVTALASGEAFVKAVSVENPSVYDSCVVMVTVPVVHIPVTKVELAESELNLKIDSSEILSVAILPANATNKKVLFTSENPAVAIVSESGQVNAIGVGETLIKVYSDENDAIHDFCKVIVIDDMTSNDVFENPNLEISPNPVQDVLSVSGITVGETVWIYTIQGTLVYHSTAENPEMQINFGGFAKGVYVIRVGNQSMKVIYK